MTKIKKLKPDRTVLSLVLVYIVLLLLLIAQISLSFAGLGVYGRGLVLGLGAVMVFLIGTFFMGLRQYSHMVRLFSVASILWLIFMFSLTLSDYMTR